MDDDDVTRRVLARIFRGAGYERQAFGDSEDALRRLQHSPVALLVTAR